MPSLVKRTLGSAAKRRRRMNDKVNKSDGAVCFAAPDGGEKAEPSVSPADMIALLETRIIAWLIVKHIPERQAAAHVAVLRKAIKIIQREISDELAR